MDWLNSVLGKFSDTLTNTVLNIEIWRIIVAGLILIVAMALRKILVNALILLLKKITAKTSTRLDDELVDAAAPPARLLIITIGFYFAIFVLGFKVTDESLPGHIIRSNVIIFSVFWAIYRAAGTITRLFERFSKKTQTKLDDLLVSVYKQGH